MDKKLGGLGGLPQSNIFSEIPDFTKTVHVRENSAANEAHLNANRYHFTGQCAVVMSLLLAGHVLSTRTALAYHHIGDLRRRIKDLKDHPEHPMKIDEYFEKDKNGKRTRYKIWYIYEKLSEATRVKYHIPHQKAA